MRSNFPSETDPNIFKMNVGNLPPGKEVNISITYVAELEFVEGAVSISKVAESLIAHVYLSQ